MKKAMVKVLYYAYTDYGYKRHHEVMSESDYMDLLLDGDVIVKRKRWCGNGNN